MVIIAVNSVIIITSHVTLFDVNGQDNSDTLVSTVVPSVDDLYKAACTLVENRPKLAHFLIGRWFCFLADLQISRKIGRNRVWF